uniref:MtORFvar ortholog n=1 Tax=Heterosigma akashiwo TaxID=2829 RepID=A0A1Q2TD37_HETAK|nr:hypothetical protein [Heterosigma akashiwo]BAW89553.1 hypothetical protein [Heterosigma akashiwo]BBE28098.1 MtORFvar ortholog [Heterosigma akashiwo]
MLEFVMNFFKTQRFKNAASLFTYFTLIWGGLRLLRKGFDLPIYWQGVPIEMWAMVIVFVCLWLNPRPFQTLLENIHKTTLFQALLYADLVAKEHVIKWFQEEEIHFITLIWVNSFLVTIVFPKLFDVHIIIGIIVWFSILKFFFTLDRPLIANIDWDTMVENRAPLTFETVLKAQTVLAIPYSPYLSENLKTRSFPYLQRRLVGSRAKLFPDFMQKVRHHLPELLPDKSITTTQLMFGLYGAIGVSIPGIALYVNAKESQLDRISQERKADLERESREQQANLDRISREQQADLDRKLKLDMQKQELNMQKEDLDFRKQEFEANQRSLLGRFWGLKVQPKFSSAVDLPTTKSPIVEVQKGSPKDGDFNCVLEPQLDLWDLLTAWF